MKTMASIAIWVLACVGLMTVLVQGILDIDPSTLDEADLDVDTHSINKRWIPQKLFDKQWDRGIVPYHFEAPIKDNVYPFMAVFEHETCIRFVHNNDTYRKQKHGGLNFLKGKGCKTIMGNARKAKGQRNIPCTKISVMHELGHNFGHIDGVGKDGQVFEKEKGFIRMNPRPGLGLFESTQPMNPMYITDYGMDLYTKGLRLFDLNNQNKFNTPGHNFRSNAYHMFQDISKVTKCKETYCKDFKLECVNDGFPTLVEGQCACNCPTGLDPATGCATVMNEAIYKKRVWPKGQYALPATSDGCPDDRFKQMSVEIKGNFDINPEDKTYPWFLADKLEKNNMTLQLCVMDEPATGSDTDWPSGLAKYCFYRKGNTCPEELMKDIPKERYGFSSEETTILGGSSSSQSSQEALPDISLGANTTLSYCCKVNEKSMYEEQYPLKLPTSKPFMLTSADCPIVDAMEKLIARFKVKDVQTNSSNLSPWPGHDKRLKYCYYTPYNTDCGGQYELSPDRTSVTVDSPASPQGDQCYWLFTSPPGTRMVLNFDMYKSTCNPANFIALRKMYLGSERYNPCWDFGTNRTIPTVYNTLMIEKRGKDQSFKATVSLLYEKNMCYNMADNGESYGGQVNITRDMRACLPWGKVLHCIRGYELLTIAHRLEDNYCRQFGGSGIQPWCYFNENCDRHYCDACNKEKVWDYRTDCLRLQKIGFCENDPRALQGCAATCGDRFRRDRPEAKAGIIGDAQAKCGPPNDLPGGSIVGGAKSEYSVGDRVVYECIGAPKVWQRERICLGTGKWTSLNSVCTECPFGFALFQQNCYQFIYQYKNYTTAKELCASFSSEVSSIESEDEQNFILNVVLPRPKKNHWGNYEYVMVLFKQSGKDDNIGQVYQNGKLRPGLKKNMANFVCRLQSRAPSTCGDDFDTCASLFKSNPDACEKYPEMMKINCKKTCGLCGRVDCSVERASANATLINNTATIQKNEFVQYDCKPGFLQSSGDMKRKCQENGQLGGQTLQCISKDDSIPDSIAVGVADFKKVLPPGAKAPSRRHFNSKFLNHNFISNGDYMTIPQDGEITRWEYQSETNGTGKFQVWRKADGDLRYQFIGQNGFLGMPESLEVNYPVPKNERIRVKKGDMIGVYFERLPIKWRRGIVRFIECFPGSMPQLLELKKNQKNLKLNMTEQFVDEGACFVPVFRAVVQPLVEA